MLLYIYILFIKVVKRRIARFIFYTLICVYENNFFSTFDVGCKLNKCVHCLCFLKQKKLHKIFGWQQTRHVASRKSYIRIRFYPSLSVFPLVFRAIRPHSKRAKTVVLNSVKSQKSINFFNMHLSALKVIEYFITLVLHCNIDFVLYGTTHTLVNCSFCHNLCSILMIY